MQKDYDLSNLSQRICRVEDLSKQPTFCYFLSTKNEDEQKLTQEISFEFEVKSQTYLKVQAKTLLSVNQDYSLNVYVNGVKGYSALFSGSEKQTEILLPFGAGINKLLINVQAQMPFAVDECTLQTFGNIAYVEKDCILSCINESDKSVILFISNGELRLKEYKDGQFKTKLKKQDILSGAICKLNNKLLLVTVNKKGEGLLELLKDDYSVDYSKVLDSELISVCALNKEIPALFAVRGNSIYRYDVEEMLFFRKRQTGYTGKRVISNPEVSDYIIVVEYDGNAKLINV